MCHRKYIQHFFLTADLLTLNRIHLSFIFAFFPAVFLMQFITVHTHPFLFSFHQCCLHYTLNSDVPCKHLHPMPSLPLHLLNPYHLNVLSLKSLYPQLLYSPCPIVLSLFLLLLLTVLFFFSAVSAISPRV